jgi:phenylalanyl-tRNA synthetase beta chain
MKISLDWLADFVDFNEKDPQRIAEVLTLGAAEVDEVEVQGALLDDCCVGKVLTVEKHPDADKLMLCDVETDKGKKRIVCGGQNLREGMLVAFAHIGANVRWHGEEMMVLKPVKIRGEKSEGMICGADELDLTAQFPNFINARIVDLGDDTYPVGQSLKEALGLHDVILHIDNHSITHRADLFSHIGFARECVALGLGKWKKDPLLKAPKFSKDAIPFKMKVDAPKLMSRYCSCMIHIDNMGETPDWMKKRLEATGWRSLNLPIDITNYVAMEIGVPLHSFDADDIKGDVHMREAKKGEKITTLDQKERELPEGGLILSDDAGIFDLLGIMGGLRSSTKESTRKIYLHSASLNPISIRKAVIATGLRTDAATVYEKGVPHITTEQGFYRAAQLMCELIPGAQIVSAMDSKGDNGSPKPIELSLSRVSSHLGREITTKEATTILKNLEFDVAGKGDVLKVTPPLHRLGDISEFADLTEEIARIAGFKSFEEELPCASTAPPERDHRTNQMRDILQDAGFNELVTFAFAGEELLAKAGLDVKNLEEIENPLGEDIKYMRPSLLPRLLEFAEENMQFVGHHLRVFEVGNVFHSGKDESKHLTLLVAAKTKPNAKSEPLLLAKAAAAELLQSLNLDPSFIREKKASAEKHPARTVNIQIGKETVGELYELHPSIIKNIGLPDRAAVVTLDLSALLSSENPERIYREITEFPSITYDTTISFSDDKEVGPILNKTRGSHNLLRSVELVDLYKKGAERQLTFRCTYNAMDRTLTEEEIKPVHEKVEATLQG